ncbi:MAG TPA: hypothetical protein PKN23_08380, partial [Candidatus Hydrogenedentes bacterium]|nr:hypothetical protein [Candidatus Hydrogenedentota bacterium]
TDRPSLVGKGPGVALNTDAVKLESCIPAKEQERGRERNPRPNFELTQYLAYLTHHHGHHENLEPKSGTGHPAPLTKKRHPWKVHPMACGEPEALRQEIAAPAGAASCQ